MTEEKTFFEHLYDLKKIIFQIAIVWVISCGLIFLINSQVINFLTTLANKKLVLHFLSPLDGLLFNFKIVTLVGTVFSIPFFELIALSYIRDVILRKNKVILIYYLITANLLAIIGSVYGLKFIIPVSLKFLLQISYSNSVYLITGNEYLNFIVATIVFLVVGFQIPIILFGLIHFGVLKTKDIESKRREIYFSILIMSAFFGSPEIFSWLISSLCVVIMFEVTLILAKLVFETNINKYKQYE